MQADQTAAIPEEAVATAGYDVLMEQICAAEGVWRVYGKTNDAIIVLVDGTDLIHKYKAFVAAIPYRKRAIPLGFKAYTNQQIRDMVYLSENDIIWEFLDLTYETIQKVFPGRRVIFIFDRGFADEKLISYLKHMGANHIMRVPRNCGIEAFEYRGKLSTFGRWGYFRNVSYHLGKPIQMNLLCAENDRDKDDPVFLVSDMDDLIALIHRKRTQIEEGFRDMKSLFGFKHLVLKKATQQRIEILSFWLSSAWACCFCCLRSQDIDGANTITHHAGRSSP